MEGGAAERDRLLRQQIAAMTPDRFEHLVFELAQREDPTVRRLSPPDGGADAIRPATADRRAGVWQAKHYPTAINWSECENSLDTAITRWNPETVTFVFPRDLSEQLEAAFDARLLQSAAARDAGTAVRIWNLSEVVRRLGSEQDIKRRFFGSNQEDIVARFARFAEAGGALDDGRDIVDRAFAIGAFIESQDADFTHAITTLGTEGPEPTWSTLPFMSIEVENKRVAVRIDAWPREGANVELPTFSFSSDDAGRASRAEAIERLARGETAVVTVGGQLRLQVPVAMRPFVEDAKRSGGSITLTPGAPLELGIEIECPGGETQARTLQIRPVPPRPGARLAFAGYVGYVLIELNIELLEEPEIRLSVSFTARWGPNTRANIDAAQLLHALLGHERITLRNASLFPNADRMGRFHQHPNQEMLAQVEKREAFYRDVALIEATLDLELVIPEELQHNDIRAAATAASVLRTGEGSATFEQAEATVSSADIPHVLERIRSQGTVRQRVTYPLFGAELDLGEADYEIPPLRIVNVIPHGVTPDAPARVVVAADGDGQLRFRLVNCPNPTT